jgi:hypothetical protein
VVGVVVVVTGVVYVTVDDVGHTDSMSGSIAVLVVVAQPAAMATARARLPIA